MSRIDADRTRITQLKSELAEARRDVAAFRLHEETLRANGIASHSEAVVRVLDAEQAAARLLTLNATLREACKPFATFGELLELETSGFADTDKIELSPEGSDLVFDNIEIGSFRRARAALAGHEQAGAKDPLSAEERETLQSLLHGMGFGRSFDALKKLMTALPASPGKGAE